MNYIKKVSKNWAWREIPVKKVLELAVLVVRCCCCCLQTAFLCLHRRSFLRSLMWVFLSPKKMSAIRPISSELFLKEVFQSSNIIFVFLIINAHGIVSLSLNIHFFIIMPSRYSLNSQFSLSFVCVCECVCEREREPFS